MTNDTAVWAPSNTGTKVHAFIGTTTDGTRLRAACRANITREKDAILKDRSAFVLVCETCEAKWDACLARLEASVAPVNPYDQVCEGVLPEEAPEAVTAEEIQSAGDELFTPQGSAARAGQCTATTVRGYRCINPAAAGSAFCVTHGGRRRTTRQARRVLADRRRTNRAAAKLRRRGVATMAGHAIAAGLRPSDARSMASSLRRNAEKAQCWGTVGLSYAGRRPVVACTRYTRAEVARVCESYRPRRDDFRRARAALIAVAE